MGSRARVEALRCTLVACLVTALAPACGETIKDPAEPAATMGSASDAGGSLSQATTNTTATGSGGSSSSSGSGGAAGASCDANAGGRETWPALDYSSCAAPLVGEGGAAGDGSEAMCVGVGYEARAAPTSLFLLVDDSVHATRFELERWSSLLDAVQRLANAPATGEVWVGLELMSRAAEAAGAAEHAPLVPLVEGNSWPLVHRELSSAEPEGMPATLPALETALVYARSHASEHGERRTSLVLVSSGYTPACSGEATLDLLENAVAEAHHAASPVTTFVIDLGAEPTLESVAAAGGTEHASWFDEFDPSEALLDALLGALTSTAQSTGLCQYELPGPPWVDDIDTDLISVWYYEGRSVGEVPRVAGLAECDTAASGGWYLPRAVGGSAGRVILCPCSCSFAQGRTIELGLGCRASVP